MEIWQEELSCASRCFRCDRKVGPDDPRILSVYDHKAICMGCKEQEIARPDYQEVSMQVAAYCLIHAEAGEADRQGYCYHHFYPYRCR